MINSGDLNFSFAGLKTAVLYSTRKAVEKGIFDNDYKISLALEFEMAVTETLVFKTKKAIEKIGAKALILGGGVSANSRIRKAMEVLSESFSIHLFKPSEHVSGDNALMIALAGSMKESSSYTDRIIANGTKDLEN
jgi:N6-L-threonylcarbamoyladenine synthase